jgi:hydroxyacylglutathione hydrolase
MLRRIGLAVRPIEEHIGTQPPGTQHKVLPVPISVHQFACLSDNYGYLVRDEASGLATAIDTPDADAVLNALRETGWTLALILNTHWHPDHAGGNAAVKAATGAEIVGPREVTRVAPLDREVRDGAAVSLGETTFQVMDTGGHTLGHISYYDDADHIVFVGDTLFALGCGRLFEGTAEQMWASLSRLAALPDDTRVYCAHEYTASNARFALSVDQSLTTKARAEQVFAARERGEPTVPTTIGAEKAANPFLRAPLLASALGLKDATPAQAFAAVRAAKDAFKG